MTSIGTTFRPTGALAAATPGLVLLVLVLVFGAAPASAQDAAAVEKAEIDSLRRSAEERYRARERECRERFVVTSCVEEAQRQRRAALDALRARELKLDEARRRTRAAERRAEIAEKMAEDAKRTKEGQDRATRPQAAPREPREVREPREPRQPRQALPSPGARAPGVERGRNREPVVEDPAARREREERSRAAFEARQRRAAEHRDSSVERTIKRMHERDPAAPLPVPPASAARGSRPASGS